jgi:NTP pyrophosphatase (non-canonical NTP hydrolase)
MSAIANSFVAVRVDNMFETLQTGKLPNEPEFETVRYDEFVRRLFKVMSPEMMKAHCAMGVSGEAGELCDAIKKEIIYGQPADRKNIVEELGDLRFYIQATQQMYDISEGEVLQANAHKLSERYKKLVYSDQAAKDRVDKNAQN